MNILERTRLGVLVLYGELVCNRLGLVTQLGFCGKFHGSSFFWSGIHIQTDCFLSTLLGSKTTTMER